MPQPRAHAAPPAEPPADSLLAICRRAGFEAFLAGDYQAALDLLLDAQAFSRERHDTVPIVAFTSCLSHMLNNGRLVGVDASAAVAAGAHA